jgi:UDP-N-acetylbacillosamine N-acetyltransferase
MIAESAKIVIYGCGGHARSVADVLLSAYPAAELVFVDPAAREGERLFGFAVCRRYPRTDEPFVVAIGNNMERKIRLCELGDAGLVSVISPLAYIGRDASIGPGCFLGNFSHIGPLAVVGRNTIVNTGVVVEHEVTIGEHCHIGPDATISGRCQLGELVFVGAGTTVKDYVSICPNVTIGAGATVVSNIVESGTYVGTPARKNK